MATNQNILAAIIGVPPLAGYANNSDLIPVGDISQIGFLLPITINADQSVTLFKEEDYTAAKPSFITRKVLAPGAIDSSNWLVNPNSAAVKVVDGEAKVLFLEPTFDASGKVTGGTISEVSEDDAFEEDGSFAEIEGKVPIVYQSDIPATHTELAQAFVGLIPEVPVTYAGIPVYDIMPAGENPDIQIQHTLIK